MDQFNLSDGTYIRFSERGEGPNLLLLHTIRNRIEYYEKVLPLLTKKFKVFCVELPGHGDSPINKKTNYNIEFITNSIIEFIDQKQLEDITIAGESIGAVLASTVAIKIPSKVEKIYCFNPYDYDTKFGEGVSRGNLISKFLFLHMRLPFGIGYFFSKLECFPILWVIFRGGVFKKKSILKSYISSLARSIRKKHFTYHERNIFFNFILSKKKKEIYNNLKTDVHLIYGDHDWSNNLEREETMKLLGLNSFEVMKDTGHFSFLESPMKVAELIKA